MNQSNNILRTAVALCFGAMAGQAMAVVDLSLATPGVPVKIAKEIPANTTLVDAPAASYINSIKLRVPAGYAITTSNPLYVKLDLTNGAKFAGAAPTITCQTIGATTAGLVTIGGLGQSNIVFQINVAGDTSISGGAASANTCSADFSGVTISGLNDVTLSATVEYKNGLNNVVTGLATPYVTFVRGMTATVLSADGAVVVDATSGSDNFDVATSNKGASLAVLGNVRWTQDGGSASTGLAGANVSASDIITTAFVTVTGPAIGAAMAANGVSGVFLDAAASACTTVSYKVSASGTNSVTFNNVTTAHIQAGVNVCLNVSGGTTVIPTGQFSATISGTQVSNVTANFAPPSDKLETLTSNGTTANAYMVNASTSAAKTSVVRLINTGAVDAVFTATAYTEDLGSGDGLPVAKTTLGTANSTLATIATGGALNLTSAQLESKLGFTPSTGTSKYRVVISAGTNAITILNYTKDTATGVITLSQ